MARKIKTPLFLNDVEVRDIESLRENFNVIALADYAFDGSLIKFLRERYYEVEAEKVEALTRNDPDLENKLYEIFKVEKPLDAEEIAWRTERLEKLKQFTSDENILAKVDSVAFNQEDLGDLLDEGVAEIYLCGGKFTIPLKVKNKKYIGIGDAVAIIPSESPVDFDALNISFENITHYEAYAQIAIPAAKNSDDVIKYLTNAAESGNADAMYIIGNLYHANSYFKWSDKKAFEWHLKAAEAGNVFAMESVAYCYWNGHGTKIEQEKAFEWYMKAATAGDSNAMWQIARLYNSSKLQAKKNKAKAFEWCLKAANAGDANAMYDIADFYRNGEFVNKDTQKVLEWETKAAEAGHTYAMDHMMEAFIEGSPVSENTLQKIFENLTDSAENNPYNSNIMKLAKCYEKGVGVQKDLQKAFEWYVCAAEYGYGEAFKIVGDFYYKGELVPQDKSNALEWYIKFYENAPSYSYPEKGDVALKAAEMYENGDGVEKNHPNALLWYYYAAINDSDTAKKYWQKEIGSDATSKIEEYLDKFGIEY